MNLQHSGHLITDAVIMGFLDRSIDVLLIDYGFVKRVYLENMQAPPVDVISDFV